MMTKPLHVFTVGYEWRSLDKAGIYRSRYKNIIAPSAQAAVAKARDHAKRDFPRHETFNFQVEP